MDISSDSDNHPSHSAISYTHAPVASSSQSQLSVEHAAQPSQSHATGQPRFSNGPHIRSRITVVCAECKRLKLKCDRRTPCSSCLKRDTVARCVYSQAAAEKIDVQSLHNRILTLEAVFNKLTEANPNSPLASLIGNISSLKPPYPSASLSSVNLAGTAGNSQLSTSGSLSQGSLAGLPCNDRALLAVGASGSSVVISLEDVANIWLTELDESHLTLSGADPSGSATGSSRSARVKLEPTPVLMPPIPSPMFSSRGSTAKSRLGTTFVPPIPYETFLPSATVPSTHVATSANPYPSPTPQANLSEPPQVTPALLERLPPPEARVRFLKALNETMMLHPCFNVRHFEQRVEAMLGWGEAGAAYTFSTATAAAPTASSMKALAQDLFFGQPGKQGKPGGKDARTSAHGVPQHGHPPGSSPKPTLSFFAAACAAFALGALVSKGPDSGAGPEGSRPPSSSSSGSSTGDADPSGPRCSPAALFALSEQALGLYERTALYDLDVVVAMILQILYQLHDGQMSVAQGVFPLVGKMINVARMMGLAIDPDEFPGTYSLFEAETRRRIWWDVFYYDLFVSDCMGHPPLIPDNSFTTRLPAEVDEEQFNPSSTTLPTPPSDQGIEKGTVYFALKCRLAQLVKNVKKQTFRDPLGDDPSEPSIEQAAAFEGEVAAFLADLPPAFRLELDHDWAEPVLPSSSVPPFLQAQKCELAILANRLILKLYLPFLKDGGPASGRPVQHQAVFGTIQAAHMIIYASRRLHAVWRHSRPAAFDFYDFRRTLFDAAVVCAHAAVQHPASILAAEAIKGVGCALDVMRELGASRGGLEGTHGEASRLEAIKIVEMMKRKAEAVRGANSGNNAAAGTKRKRLPLEDEAIPAGFQLPFVGVSVSSVRADPPKQVTSPSKAMNAAAKDTEGRPKGDAKRQAKEKEREKEKDKSSKFPPVSIRARPSQNPPSSRPRTSSVSSNAPPPASSSSSRLNAATPAGAPLPPPPPSQTPSLPPSMAESPRVVGYEHYPSRPSQTPVQEQIPDDYAMHYSSEDPGDRRRYSSSFGDSPPAPSLFEQSSFSQPSPASYSTGPTPPNYYAHLHYAPPPGPPPAPAPQAGFESSAMSHSQSLPPMAALQPPPHMSMDTPAGAAGLPMSTMPEQYMPPFEKTHPPSYMQRPPEHPRQMAPEYPPPPPQAMPPQAWMHNPSANTWEPYKY